MLTKYNLPLKCKITICRPQMAKGSFFRKWVRNLNSHAVGCYVMGMMPKPQNFREENSRRKVAADLCAKYANNYCLIAASKVTDEKIQSCLSFD